MATRASRAAFIRQTFSALNFKGELSPNKREATVFHPGLTYGDFHGRTPAIWKLMKVMEGSRFFAHHAISPSGDNFMEYDTLTNDRMTFIGSTEFLVGRGMYVRSVTKSPLDVKLCLHHIGKSSLSTQARVFCHDSEQLLLSNINQVVSIDPASRRPLPLPDWWRDKYSVATISQTPMVVQSEARPDDAIRNDVIVSWSDTDFYEHTNWTSYVKYCVDAANLCSLKGHLREVASDTVRENAVKTLRVRYSGESLLGDTLQVYAWEVAQNAIKFQICKDDTPICFIFMEYFLASDLDDH